LIIVRDRCVGGIASIYYHGSDVHYIYFGILESFSDCLYVVSSAEQMARTRLYLLVLLALDKCFREVYI
jgi:hypothetical protein